MSDNIVEVNGLSRQFGNKIALNGVNYEISQGQIYGLVGANGAGKTTLIKHLLGLMRAKSGSVKVFGFNPVHNPVEVLGRIGYLSEERELPEWMTIEELMCYTQAYYPGWDSDYAQQLVVNFGLDSSKKIKELSKGMRAQAGLVAAVAHRPELLLLDEPSSGLDAIVRGDILDAIVRTVVDDGRTVIFSSHLLEEVERMSDHVTMIHKGKISLNGNLEDIQSAHLRSTLKFSQPLESVPAIVGALSAEGVGRSWQIVHETSVDEMAHTVAKIGGEIVQSRPANLEEIFVARVGRDHYRMEQEVA